MPRGAPERGAIMRLALRLTGHAQSRGMTLVRLRRTLIRRSQSAYIYLKDARGRCWIIRVSDHFRPNEAPHHWPHFDFVTPGGDAGFISACRTIDLIAIGEFPWHDPVHDASEVADRIARFAA